ncbi:MAG: hypothetical protein Q4F21_08195 [Lachnospiraceae bacterium]|nr:hypothetical protein [Lachnospiraceae bacterium]
MEIVDIRIIDIIGKWFIMRLFTEKNTITIQNSCLFGNDAPSIFLRVLYRLAKKKSVEEYIKWDEESGAYIWILIKEEDDLTIEIWSSLSTLNFFYDGKEILREKRNELLFEVKTSFYFFTQNVIDEFENNKSIFNKEAVEYEFPTKVLMELKKIIGYR